MITISMSREMFSYVTSALNNEALRYKEWAEDEPGEIAEDFLSTAVEYRRIELYFREQMLNSLKEEQKAEQKAEVFYTGGGIWISAKYISDHVYATVDNDFDECVSYYNDMDDDGTRFGCMNLLESKSIDEMNVADRAIYNELHTALEEKVNKDLPEEN